jgi:nucleotide-binding universal stress UspA family protein
MYTLGYIMKRVTRRDSAAARLRTFLKDERIDMMVMGAFVHSRFRQAILGGVTRHVLGHARLPVLMAL